MGSVSSLERVFENIFEQGAYRVIVNLEQASYIASSGIGILVSSCKTAKDNGGDFILCSIMPKVKQVFDMVGLQNIVRYAQNTKDALRILNKRK
jgi:anti-anti-sigma factor